MTIQTQSYINDEDNFKSAFKFFLSQISRSQTTPELDAIVKNGLEVVQEVDDLYSRQGIFSEFSQYLLYKAAFNLWSYQHQVILESLKNPGQKDFIKYAQLVTQHKNVAIVLFDDLQNSADVNDPVSLRDSWLITWRRVLTEISPFFSDLVTSKKSTRKPFGLRLRISEMSPETRYIVIATCIFVLGIVIATLLLIRW